MDIREANLADDMPFLETMLYQAALGASSHAPNMEDPYYASYHRALVAGSGETVVAEQAGRPAGAAWYRYFDSAEPGYGFRGVDVPEITIAVAPEFRGQGIGLSLMRALIQKAREAGPSKLSLNVEPNNTRAQALYVQLGFSVVKTESDGSLTMTLDTSNDETQ